MREAGGGGRSEDLGGRQEREQGIGEGGRDALRELNTLLLRFSVPCSKP